MKPPVIGVTGRQDPAAVASDNPTFCLGQTYLHAIEITGGAPMIIVPSGGEGTLRAVFDRLDGLVLSGGGDLAPAHYGEEAGDLLWYVDDRRDRAELALARWALTDRLPLLAICRGIQVLNVAAGGSLYQDVATQVPGSLAHPTLGTRPMADIAHTVDVVRGTRIATIFGGGELNVNSAHHQAVRAVGAGLLVTARAPDGVIEGLEAPSHPFCVGVQWHPEAMVDVHPAQRGLFEALVTAARSARA